MLEREAGVELTKIEVGFVLKAERQGWWDERAIYDMSMYHCSSQHLGPYPHTNLYRCHNDLFLKLILV